MQSELIELLFGDFINNFNYFFAQCEKGFRNEIVVNMKIRAIDPN
jgi:hypothetical protein